MSAFSSWRGCCRYRPSALTALSAACTLRVQAVLLAVSRRPVGCDQRCGGLRRFGGSAHGPARCGGLGGPCSSRCGPWRGEWAGEWTGDPEPTLGGDVAQLGICATLSSSTEMSYTCACCVSWRSWLAHHASRRFASSRCRSAAEEGMACAGGRGASPKLVTAAGSGAMGAAGSLLSRSTLATALMSAISSSVSRRPAAASRASRSAWSTAAASSRDRRPASVEVDGLASRDPSSPSTHVPSGPPTPIRCAIAARSSKCCWCSS